MFNRIDLLMTALLILYFYKGWDKGLFRALIGPIALAICTLIGILYSDLTKNLIMGFFIVFVGGFLLSGFLTICLIISRGHIDPLYRNYVFWGSRLLGGVVNFAWLGTVTALFFFLVTLIPSQQPILVDAQRLISESGTYSLVYQKIFPRMEGFQKLVHSLSILKDPAQMDQLSHTKELEDLASHPKIQELLADEVTARQVRNRDYGQLMKNPKFWALLQDQKLMKKVSAITRKIYVGNIGEEETPSLEQRLSFPTADPQTP